MAKKLGILLFLFFLYIFLHQFYSPRVSAFGCFDDCANFVAGYFLTKGKTLYSQVSFDHQPLMAHLSYLVQTFFHPINIYQLVLHHRQLVMVFGFLMNALFILRFGLVGLGFSLFYEFSKFYLFGDRFLAEGLIVYTLVYLTGLVWQKFQKRKIYFVDYILTAIFAWFVIFMRETFVPLAIILFILILWGKPFNKAKKISLGVFLALVFFILLTIPPKEYFLQVGYNFWTTFIYEKQSGDLLGWGILKPFFYPFILFFGGKWNLFRHLLVGLGSVFLLLFFCFYRKTELLAIIIFLLGLANIRVVQPGRIFYDAFHMLPWYGMFVFIINLLVVEVIKVKKGIGILFSIFLVCLFIYFLASPKLWIYEKIDPHGEFITNFGKELHVGEVVKVLSTQADTLFLDGFDDLIYWQADRLSSYKYSWYTGVMPQIPKFREARWEMFKNYPPDFYYGTCPDKKVEIWTMPKEFIGGYQQLYSEGKPTCLYVKKTKIPLISKERWKKAKELGYELPSKQYGNDVSKW